MSLNPQEFTLEKELNWQQVFKLWQQEEGDRPEWRAVYQEKGFDTWEEWRQTNVAQFKPDQRTWQLYTIVNPLQIVPTFFGGPHRSWIEKYYGGQQVMTFRHILEQPEFAARFTNPQDKLTELAINFPAKTVLISVAHQNRVIILEGTHRCCAITYLAQNNQPLSSQIQIALTEMTKEPLPTIGHDKKG